MKRDAADTYIDRYGHYRTLDDYGPPRTPQIDTPLGKRLANAFGGFLLFWGAIALAMQISVWIWP